MYLSIYLSICVAIYLSFYRSIDRSIDLSIYLLVSIDRSIDLSIYLSIYLSISLSLYLAISLSVSLSIYLSARSKTKKFCETSSMFEHNNVQNETILRDVFTSWTWQHPKRNKSARLLHLLNLATSKTKQFCEASFKNGKLSAELTVSYQCVLRFFQSTCLKYCACHGNLMPGHTKCCTCHAKSS